jgi:hypothetical protein
MNIFDDYTAEQIREIWREDTNSWPEDFCNHINRELAYDLLDDWLHSHDNDEYREKTRDIIENLTYGCEDGDGNELLEFNPMVDNDGQMRLF